MIVRDRVIARDRIFVRRATIREERRGVEIRLISEDMVGRESKLPKVLLSQ